MKLRLLTLALATLSVSAQAQTLPQAQPMPFPFPIPTFAPPASVGTDGPKTSEAWLNRMTDFTQNASAYRDPKQFVPWFNAVTEPQFYAAAANGMLDPSGWLNMTNSMANPNALRNWMWMTDPGVYMRWMQAGVDPAFYTAMLTTMTDPGKMMRWMMMPMDPKMWSPVLNMLDPNTLMKWSIAPMDPRAWQLMGNVMNPALYTGYMGAMLTPGGAPQAPAKPAGSPYSTDLGNWFNWMPPNAANTWGTSTAGTSQPAPSIQAPAAPVVAAVAPPSPAAPTVAPVAAQGTDNAPQKLSLAGDTLFALGKSGIKDLTAAGKASLDELVTQIKAAGQIEQIRIVGHADVSGKAASNQRLSENRARSVKAYLVSKGVKSDLIVTSGVGSSQPVVQCDMKLPSKELAACLAPNRRVEIEVAAKAN